MVKDLVTGGSFSCVLSTEGKVKCWGLNNYGQLGLGDTNNRGDTSNEMGDSLPFVDLGTGRTAVMISAGNTHACAWLDNNTLKCWGRNFRGELGYGDTNDRGDGPGEMGDALPPVDLGSVGEIREIDLGDTVSCARFSSGQVKCWGRNTFGILALGHTDNIGDGPGEMGSNLSNLNLGSGFTIEDIMLGDDALCALSSEGEVKCTGNLPSYESANLFGDSTGEIGDGIPVVNLGTGVRVKALPNGNSGIGSNTMCALLLDHSVKCWGYNADGQLGLGSTENRGDGPGEMGDALSALDLQAQTTVQGLVKLGSGHCAMIGDGTLKCWGRNHRGQLGLAHTDNIGDGPGEMGSSTPSVDLGFVLKFE
jgi:alpha-tubulin suppressor-like RCC1 family protein